MTDPERPDEVASGDGADESDAGAADARRRALTGAFALLGVGVLLLLGGAYVMQMVLRSVLP